MNNGRKEREHSEESKERKRECVFCKEEHKLKENSNERNGFNKKKNYDVNII